MAFLIPNIMPRDPMHQIYIAGVSILIILVAVFAITLRSSKNEEEENLGAFTSFLRFFYVSFLKPHTGDGTGNGQQDALESFYKAQAGVYDTTRKRLLRGREDMLGLVAAQLVHKAASERTHDPKRIWVDVSELPGSCEWLLITDRLAEVPATISRLWVNTSMSKSSSPAFIWWISLHHCATLLASASNDLAGKMSRLFVKMLARFDSKIMRSRSRIHWTLAECQIRHITQENMLQLGEPI